jgi:hypothetical protein
MELKKLYGDEAKQNLLIAGFGVYREVVQIASAKNPRVSEQTLTDVLHATRLLVQGKSQHPTGVTGYENEIHHYLKLSEKVSQASGKQVLVSLMLSLLSVLIIMTAGIIAFASLGILAPLSLFGVLFGKALLFGAVTTASTCIVGTGTMFGNAALFFNSVKSGVLTNEMQSVEEAARKLFS